MELLLLILVIGVPFLIVFIINKKQEQETNQSFNQKLEDIDLEEYNKQEEQEIDKKINTLQNDLIFTKDYIKNVHSDNQLRILKSQELIRAYHYVFSKTNMALAQCKRYKFIVLEFEDDLCFFINDIKNQKTLSKWYKHNEQFDFDDTLLNLLKKYYPHIQIGYETNHNDIKVFNTNNKAHTPMNGLYTKSKRDSHREKSDTLEKEIIETQQNTNYCNQCGSRLTPNAKFCNKCGNKIHKD